MKYILTENKLNQTIYKFIDEMFNTDHINYLHPEDEYGNEDPNRCLFYFNNYLDDDSVFRWYGKGYWDDDWEVWEKRINLIAKSPIISVEEQFSDELDNFFGELWKPVFLKWFNENYPKYKSKTVNF